MKRQKTRHAARRRRHLRVRKKIYGTAQRPRFSVFRSLSHIYAQLIDDDAGQTLVAASDLDAAARQQRDGKRKSEAANMVGQLLGQRAIERGITEVVFDRGGYRYHGRIKQLAEGAREAGLKF